MNKLYVLIRKDLTTSQQAVQAGHAVAEYLLKTKNNKWTNGTLIYLGVPNGKKLKSWCDKLNFLDISYVCFKEPDLNNEITALAVIPEDANIFKNLQLI